MFWNLRSPSNHILLSELAVRAYVLLVEVPPSFVAELEGKRRNGKSRSNSNFVLLL